MKTTRNHYPDPICWYSHKHKKEFIIFVLDSNENIPSQKYDIFHDKFIDLTPTPSNIHISGHDITLNSTNNCIYIITRYGDIIIYNLFTNQWYKSVVDLNSNTVYSSLTYSSKNKIYFYSPNNRECHSFNPNTQKLCNMIDMGDLFNLEEHNVYDSAMIYVDNKLFILGGTYFSKNDKIFSGYCIELMGTFCDDIYLLDLNKDIEDVNEAYDFILTSWHKLKLKLPIPMRFRGALRFDRIWRYIIGYKYILILFDFKNNKTRSINLNNFKDDNENKWISYNLPKLTPNISNTHVVLTNNCMVHLFWSEYVFNTKQYKNVHRIIHLNKLIPYQFQPNYRQILIDRYLNQIKMIESISTDIVKLILLLYW
eukprot:108746_1